MHANMDTTTPTLDMDPVLVPPEPNVLVENCGASVIVVLTKSDTFGDLNDEQLNKVQYHVRQFCLHHGAALVRHFSYTPDYAECSLLFLDLHIR